MTNALFLTAAFLIGAFVPLQLAFNAQLGSVTKSPFTAGLIVFLIGSLALTVLVLTLRPQLPTVADLTAAPKTVGSEA